MDRKTALATAGAVAVTLAASAFAFAVNLGIVGGADEVARLETVAAATSEPVTRPPVGAPEPRVITIFADEPGPPGAEPVQEAAGPAPASGLVAGSFGGDRSGDGDRSGHRSGDDDRSGRRSGHDDDDHDDDDDRSGRRSGDEDERRRDD